MGIFDSCKYGHKMKDKYLHVVHLVNIYFVYVFEIFEYIDELFGIQFKY